MVRVLVGLLVVMCATTASNARAATFRVNHPADTTDGVCGPAVGECTLREAIEDTVATAGRDTILFDPTVFPRDGTGAIGLTSPLPVIADGAGTVIDGAGAGVLLFGNGPTVTTGLVFASAPGAGLEKVTVANLNLVSFAGTGVTVCGGAPPDCADDVAGVLLQNVAVGGIGVGDGVRIEGDTVTKVRMLGVAVSSTPNGCGIRVLGKGSVIGVRVEGSSTLASGGFGGIRISAAEDLIGATVIDSLVIESAGTGIALVGRDVLKSVVTNVLARDNSGNGVHVVAARNTTGTKVTNVTASGNGDNGVAIEAVDTNRAATLTGVTVDGNDADGVVFLGPSSGAKITRTVAIANLEGLDLSDGAATGAKIQGVVAAANGTGIMVRLKQGVLQQVQASTNTINGIVITEEQGGSTIKNNIASANDGFGIILGESTGNVVQKNVALGNDVDDLHDEIQGCDANDWKANVFRRGNQPCVR